MRYESSSTARLLILLSLCVFLCGCADVLKQPYPAKNYFGIETGLPDGAGDFGTTAATQTAHHPVVMIRAVRVVPPFDGIAFVYQIGPAQYSIDYYVNWIAAPAALLTADLTGWLTSSGSVIAVAPDSSVQPDFVLETTVTKLLINRTDPAHPVAEMAVHFIMTKRFADATATVFDAVDSAHIAAADNTPAAYAAAWGKAYRSILEPLTAKLQSAMKR